MHKIILILTAFLFPDAGEAQDVSSRYHIGRTPFSEVRSGLGFYEAREFDRSMSMFIDVHACDIPDDDPWGGGLDWERFHNLTDVRVCIFLKAESLVDPESMVKWLEYRGFSAEVRDSHGVWPSERPPTVYASLSANSDETGLFDQGFMSLARRFDRSLSLSVGYDENSLPLNSTVVVIWE